MPIEKSILAEPCPRAPDDLAPFGGVRADQLGELLRRAANRASSLHSASLETGRSGQLWERQPLFRSSEPIPQTQARIRAAAAAADKLVLRMRFSLLACRHSKTNGSSSIFVGRHGAMNPAGRARIRNIMPILRGYSRASQSDCASHAFG